MRYYSEQAVAQGCSLDLTRVTLLCKYQGYIRENGFRTIKHMEKEMGPREKLFGQDGEGSRSAKKKDYSNAFAYSANFETPKLNTKAR